MVNIMLWVLAGGIAGWIGYTYMKFNARRGLMISIVIGMAGGYFGGRILAPMLGSATAVNAGDFSPFPLFIALASAAACLIIGNMIHERFGV